MRFRPLALLVTLALGLLAAPMPVEGQRAGKVYRIGTLGFASPTDAGALRLIEGFKEGLRELGYVEGENIAVEHQWAEGKHDWFPAQAAELVRRKVNVIVTDGSTATRPAISATKTIPIVFTFVGDPVRQGFVASLARPGGNVTGVTYTPVFGKQLELLSEIVPGLTRVAVLLDSTQGGWVLRAFEQVQVAAQALRVELQPIEAQQPGDFEPAFTAMTKGGASALLVIPSYLTWVHRSRITDLATKYRLPAIYGERAYAEAGGLISYAPSLRPIFRRAGVLVGKILNGAKPADLPVERPTQFEMVINLKTAKALGLTIPDSLLFQANRVIR